MSYETLIWEQSGGSGRLTLNRPDSLNSWTTEFGHELRQVLEGEAADASVRAVLVTGAGRGFSSGADLKSGFEPHPDDGRPNLRKELDEIYHPVITAVRAFQMALLGERVPARTALDWGLINQVHPDDKLIDEATALVDRMASGPTRSYASSKKALNNMLFPNMQEQLELESELQHELGRTADFMEGALAFVEKREAKFTGA